MKKKFYILMCLASLVLMVTACGGKEKIKEKLRAATEAVKERKEAAASEKGSDLEMDKQGDRPDNGGWRRSGKAGRRDEKRCLCRSVAHAGPA